MDSLAVVGWVGTQVDAALPGLDPVARSLLLGVLVSLALTAIRWLVAALGAGQGRVAAFWEQHREWLNPLVAAILGFLGDGGWIGMLLGGAGRGIVKSVTSLAKGGATAAGVRKAKAAALALALGGLLMASGAAAQGIVDETKPAPAKAERASIAESLVFAAGFGARRDFSDGAQLTGFVGGQVGYVWNDHVSPRLRVTRDLTEGAVWNLEGGIWFVW